jgi:hypothetical protein
MTGAPGTGGQQAAVALKFEATGKVTIRVTEVR